MRGNRRQRVSRGGLKGEDFRIKAAMERLAFAGGEQECLCCAVVGIYEHITLLAPYSVSLTL